VKADWEEKQKRKAELAKEKEAGKAKGDEKDGEKSKDESSKDTTKTPPEVASPVPTSTPQKPSHEKYTLHRDMFALRTAEHRKRKQTAQARELAPKLPGAPRNAIN